MIRCARALKSGHRLSFAEANPKMLVPLVTVTLFDVILMLRGKLLWVGGHLAFTSPHLFRAGDDRSPVWKDLLQEAPNLMTTQPERPISEIRVQLTSYPICEFSASRFLNDGYQPNLKDVSPMLIPAPYIFAERAGEAR